MDRDLRRLLVTAVVLLLVLLVGRLAIGSLYDVGALERRVAAERRALSAGGAAGAEPRPEDVRRADALRDALETELADAVEAVAYALPPEFDVPAGGSPDLRYFEVLRREQERLVKGASYRGTAVPPNLGMPDLNPTGLEDVLATLRSLHVVHRVVGAALDAGVASVDEIAVPVARRARSGDDGVVDAQRVEFALRATPRAVRETLAAVVTGEPYLALDDVRLRALDEDGASVEARFAALALRVDAAATEVP